MLRRHRSTLVPLVALALMISACGGGGTVDTPGPESEARSIVYVGMGASDAVGIGALPPTQGYVYEIQRYLQGEVASVDLQNLGISGAHIDAIVDQELSAAIAADPDIVTLWTGANDVVGGDDPDVFATALDGLLRELTSKTAAQIFVADLPDLTQAPLFQVVPDPDVTPQRIDAFNARIVAAVSAHGCVLVRLSAQAPSPNLFFVDGFHPNNAGHEEIADAFWLEMQPRL